MKIGLIGNGNIAKILSEKRRDVHSFIIIDKGSDATENFDLIIITKPMFVFIEEYPLYKKVIDKNDTLFIPGNALNKEFFEHTYPSHNVSFSFNTPYIGRWDSTYYENEFKIINLRFPENKIIECFGKTFDYYNDKIHLSNLFMHPVRLKDYEENDLNKEVSFYDFDARIFPELEKYRKELVFLTEDLFNIEIIDPFYYYDSSNVTEFASKLSSIKSLNRIKIKESRDSIVKNRYFLDDVDFKLRYIFDNSKHGSKTIRSIIEWANKMKRGIYEQN